MTLTLSQPHGAQLCQERDLSIAVSLVSCVTLTGNQKYTLIINITELLKTKDHDFTRCWGGGLYSFLWLSVVSQFTATVEAFPSAAKTFRGQL